MKNETPIRKARRKYEEVHYNERREANKVWGTSIPRKDAEKIDEFLIKNGLSKVDLIMAGYNYLLQAHSDKAER